MDEFTSQEREWEQALSIHRPEFYREYLRNKEALKEDNAGYDQIVWRTPETIEEVAEITNLVAEAHRDTMGDEEDFDRDFEAFSQHFKGIDTSLLGDDDG